MNARVLPSRQVDLLVFGSILISGSLYYATFGTNFLLVPFAILLMTLFVMAKRAVPRNAFIYTLLLFFLVFINPQWVATTSLVLVLRSLLALILVSVISFEEFSLSFYKQIKALSVISLLFIPVIAFDLPSPLPDFTSITKTVYRNFLFFGVQETFVTYDTYKNIGLWWEPGAFQIFINLAFLFGIYHGKITIRTYCLFLLVILSTQSTTAIAAFSLLSVLYFKNTRFQLRYFLFGAAIIGVYLLVFSNFYLVVFDKLNASSPAHYSAQSRMFDHAVDWAILKDHFLLGAGLGNFDIRNLYGINLLGQETYYSLSQPTGADGLLLFVSQLGIFSVFFILPLLLPKTMRHYSKIDRALIAMVMLILFNTENFSYYFLFSLLCLYGLKRENLPEKV